MTHRKPLSSAPGVSATPRSLHTDFPTPGPHISWSFLPKLGGHRWFGLWVLVACSLPIAAADRRDFVTYLGSAPPVSITVERSIKGKRDIVAVRFQNGEFVLTRSEHLPSPGFLSSSTGARVICVAGTNIWSLASRPGGVNLHHFDYLASSPEAELLSHDAWQTLNLGPQIPFGSIRIHDTTGSFTGRWGKHSLTHRFQLRRDMDGRVSEMTDTITTGTNRATHRIEYGYGETLEVPSWFPTTVSLSIRPQGQIELTNAMIWRVLKMELATNPFAESAFRPELYLAGETNVSVFLTRKGVDYALQGEKTVKVDTLDVFSRANSPYPRVAYYSIAIIFLAGTLLFALRVTLSKSK